ncbi:MAG: flagellar hook capping protein [Cellulomonas sp.]|nr:flagellar hook capping protein [Cellulomonas sp.]
MSDIPISYITNQTTGTTTTSTTASNTLDGEDFMALLIAQLKYQDPSDPMDTTAMMEQTSTLSMVEQLTAMASDSAESFGLQQRMAAAQLVGQTVSWIDSTSGETGTGVVSSVSYTSSGSTLTVGTSTVALSSVTSVTSTATSTS